MIRWLLVLGLAFSAGAPAHGACVQSASPRAGRRADDTLDRLLKAARSGRTVIRPQAARRIVRHWEGCEPAERAAIAERMLKEAGDSMESLADLGPALIEILGELESAQLRVLLWQAMADREFPWRPYAARSLAARPVAAETQRFLSTLSDPIPPVRAAGLLALGNLEGREHVQAVRLLLADEDGRVRRTAADLLARWGSHEALWWLYEELLREDKFFDRPTGEQARYQAWNLLSAHLARLEAPAEHDPGQAPSSSEAQASLEKLRGCLQKLGAGPRPDLPPQARAGGELPREQLGLELRSCRRGDVYLRWAEGDVLLVGQGNPVRVQLPEGTLDALLDAAGKTRESLVNKRLFGSPGCDLEQFHYRKPDSGDATMWAVSCGPDPIEDLRPDGLNTLSRALLQSIPLAAEGEGKQDPRLEHLRARTLAALEAVGGGIE